MDDDPAVSRSVARDLRRRYGDAYRVVRADSGPLALDALRELKLRGDQVAVLLADHRMPGMTGIEFLEQAMDIYPQARRVLLTAYADTDVAIDAVNVVDLDHYLLKPWDPPEEKFYPVIDAQLEAWNANPPRTVAETKVVGHRWSARSSEVREFLARNQVPYRWYSSDSPEGKRLLDVAGADESAAAGARDHRGDGAASARRTARSRRRSGSRSARPSGSTTSSSSAAAPPASARRCTGRRRGCGPRSSSGARPAARPDRARGSRTTSGFPDGVSGAQLTDRARRQALKFGAEIVMTRDAVGLEVKGAARSVRFDDGTSVDAHTVIVASGVAYRELDGPGIGALTGRGVYYGSALTEATACENQDIYVVGGANSAGQAAMYLSRHARSVTLVVRAASLALSMSRYLVEQVEANERIRVRTQSEVVEAVGDDHLEQIVLRDTVTGQKESVDTGWLFVFIGAAPLTTWLDGTVTRDEHGFVCAGHDLLVEGKVPDSWPLDRPPYHLETSVPGVFAAGDVRAESAKRVASAVGEGAMAVMLVHRYLEQL